MYNDLTHLSDEEIETLMNRYYNDESAKKLVGEYELKVTPSNLYKLFPPEAFAQYECENCESILVADRPSKASTKAPRYESSLYCPCCGHKPYVKCNCDYCVEMLHQQNLERLDNINRSFGGNTSPVELNALTFIEKVYLGALCRAFLRENLYEIATDNNKNLVLAPSDELRADIYNSLIRAEAIKVSPLSPIENSVVTR